MIPDKINRAIKASVRTLRQGGILEFVKKVISFFFVYEVYYVYERSTQRANINLSPESKKYKVKIIDSLEKLDDLEKKRL